MQDSWNQAEELVGDLLEVVAAGFQARIRAWARRNDHHKRFRCEQQVLSPRTLGVADDL